MNPAEVVDGILSEETAAQLVAAYFDRQNKFSGATFDELGENVVNTIGTADLLAINFLDIKIKPSAARFVIEDHADEVAALLSAVPPDVPLWELEFPRSTGHIVKQLALTLVGVVPTLVA